MRVGPAGGSRFNGGATRLTLRGWCFLAAAVMIAVFAYSAGLSELLYAACFLAVLPVVALVLARLRRMRLTVVRTFTPRVVSAGSPAVVDIEVTNQSRTASPAGTWADRIPWAPGTAGPGILPSLSAMVPHYATEGAATRLSYTLRPPARGVYDIGPLEVESIDPFSLGRGHASLGGVQQLFVIPTVVPFGEGGPMIVAGDGNARLVQRHVSGNDDDLMTREYRSGDALRRVHWRASARHGELMVRQEEQRTYPEARLLIDTVRSGYDDALTDAGFTAADSYAFEWAVKMLASLGVHLHRAGFRVQVIETGAGQVSALGDANSGGGQDHEFLLSLASLRLTDAIPTEQRAERTDAPGPIFAILADPDPRTADWIAGQRHGSEIGIAFIVGGRFEEAHQRLSDWGWICVPVRDDEDPALAWASVSRFASLTGFHGRG
ncbi:MAG: hypothetical protein QOI02_123 [Actinomycetota bacterium]|nr:hypothetical protein [Actinomycetota bacterium]